MTIKLNVIVGTTRPGRAGVPVAKWVHNQAALHGAYNATYVDLKDFALPLLDEAAHPRLRKYEHDHTRRWSESVASADAYLFVTPEYDYFPSAALVNALQCLAVEWAYKPAAVVSYGGVSGGLRATQELRVLLGNLNMMAIPQTVPVQFFSKFIKDDTFSPEQPVIDGLKLTLDELAKWSRALNTLRSS